MRLPIDVTQHDLHESLDDGPLYFSHFAASCSCADSMAMQMNPRPAKNTFGLQSLAHNQKIAAIPTKPHVLLVIPTPV
jgi:hypothetical protein